MDSNPRICGYVRDHDDDDAAADDDDVLFNRTNPPWGHGPGRHHSTGLLPFQLPSFVAMSLLLVSARTEREH